MQLLRSTQSRLGHSRASCSHFTPTCLDADSLRYYMESLNRVPLPLPFTRSRLASEVTSRAYLLLNPITSWYVDSARAYYAHTVKRWRGVCPFVCLSVCLSVYPFICLFVCLSVCSFRLSSKILELTRQEQLPTRSAYVSTLLSDGRASARSGRVHSLPPRVTMRPVLLRAASSVLGRKLAMRKLS